ncbi:MULTISPECIES: hypothetical protein [Bacillaceae]|jgi:hypothetical protein|uniref:hypothetical protein n=1 Tax=Bacillaceae TaxID=186817 RepID=UPI001642A226|nr:MULTISPECIES: hypothetical protein [Bacillaceae]MCM3122134.1 hypothetical protein [Mesobacillus sp. MER 33]MCM3232098.1 hypothetical protein [Mesobacillus sp. MER 48]
MSCGHSWSGETPQEQSDEEAQRQPQGRIAYEKDGSWSFSYSSSGKRSAWNENQQSWLTEPTKKTGYEIETDFIPCFAWFF